MDNKLNTLLYAIKSDNLVLFSEHVKDNENIAFGRFPLLSLVYMYNAKKIAREYSDKLGRQKNYEVIAEPLEFWNTLRGRVGKKLRVYMGGGLIITPLEMLALLGKDKKLKKLYNTLYVNDDIKKRIVAIYKIESRNVYFDSLGVHIERRVWGIKEKRTTLAYMFMSVACAVVVASIYVVMGVVNGFGVGGLPYKIKNETELYKALSRGDKYVLTKDLTLEGKGDLDFDGVLDGNGHTIYVDSLEGVGIKRNTGTIKNLNIVYRIKSGEISSQVGLVANKNEGTISNIKVTIEDTTITANRTQGNDCGVYGVAVENEGTISNIDIKINVELTALGDGECSLSGVAYSNSGTIKNCNIISGSSANSIECDLAGIVIYNEMGGEIIASKNYATLSQQSLQKTWSPNVAGIALSNRGTISSSINYGTLSVVSNCEDNEETGIAYVGGISANNYYVIDNCLNYGDINVSTKTIVLYAGGLVGYGRYSVVDSETTLVSTVANSGVTCNINVETLDTEAYAFVGGLCGYLYGEMENCFSLASFTQGSTDTKYFVGNAVGATHIGSSLWSTFIYLTAVNNYVLDRENVDAHIGAYITSDGTSNLIVYKNQDYNVSGISNGITTLATIDLLKSKEVYFDENKF